MPLFEDTPLDRALAASIKAAGLTIGAPIIDLRAPKGNQRRQFRVSFHAEGNAPIAPSMMEKSDA
jgi:hypothetical protein